MTNRVLDRYRSDVRTMIRHLRGSGHDVRAAFPSLDHAVHSLGTQRRRLVSEFPEVGSDKR